MAPTLQAQRREAAEEVCWTIMLMMALEGMEIPMEWRPFLAKPMQKWSTLAVRTGVMKP